MKAERNKLRHSFRYGRALIMIVAGVMAVSSCKTRNNSSLDDAGTGDGNGGDILLCEKSYGELGGRKAILLDYYQDLLSSEYPKLLPSTLKVDMQDIVKEVEQSKLAKKIQGLNNHRGKDFMQYFEQVVGKQTATLGSYQSDVTGDQQLQLAVAGAKVIAKRLGTFDDTGMVILNHYLEDFAKKSVINYQMRLSNKPDESFIPKTPGPDCNPQQIALHIPLTRTRQRAGKRFFIQQKYWDMISWSSRIGLVLHEALYRYAREQQEHESSENVQKYNRLLASGEYSKLPIKTYGEMVDDLGLWYASYPVKGARLLSVTVSIDQQAGLLTGRGVGYDFPKLNLRFFRSKLEFAFNSIGSRIGTRLSDSMEEVNRVYPKFIYDLKAEKVVHIKANNQYYISANCTEKEVFRDLPLGPPAWEPIMTIDHYINHSNGKIEIKNLRANAMHLVCLFESGTFASNKGSSPSDKNPYAYQSDNRVQLKPIAKSSDYELVLDGKVYVQPYGHPKNDNKRTLIARTQNGKSIKLDQPRRLPVSISKNKRLILKGLLP